MMTQTMIDFTKSHAELPVFIMSAYLVMVFKLPDHIPYRLPVRVPLVLWNGLLAVFSIIGAQRTVPMLVQHLSEKGFRYTVCEDPANWYLQGPCGLWVGLFIFSKVPELMDTVFLVVTKKPVIFLHWFHHATVLLYCWHSFHCRIAPGLWFAAMNYSVHAIMYSYYCLMSVQSLIKSPAVKRVLKFFAPIITTLQIVQMIVGMRVISYSGWQHMDDGNCFVDPANYKLGMAMYTSYFMLFVTLFAHKYFTPKDKTNKTRFDQCPPCVDGVGDSAGMFHGKDLLERSNSVQAKLNMEGAKKNA